MDVSYPPNGRKSGPAVKVWSDCMGCEPWREEPDTTGRLFLLGQHRGALHADTEGWDHGGEGLAGPLRGDRCRTSRIAGLAGRRQLLRTRVSWQYGLSADAPADLGQRTSHLGRARQTPSGLRRAAGAARAANRPAIGTVDARSS